MPRQKEFDSQEALDKAMHQFWAKGYYDTSIRDLVARTGVNYYGLYDVFENKRGLFLASLDRYRNTVTAEILRELKQPGPALDGIHRAFDKLLGLMITEDGHVGCLMANTAIELAPYDTVAADKVTAHMTLLTKSFQDALRRARGNGECDDGLDVKAAAEFLSTTAYSVGFLLRAGRNEAYIRRYLRTALSQLT